MNKEKQQQNDRNLRVLTRSGTSQEILSLLQQTVFGTKGKVRYRQKHIAEGMKSQLNLEFIQILKHNRVLGTTGVITRNTSGLQNGIKSLYVRYLSINNPFRKKESKTKDHSNPKPKKSNTFIKTLVGDQITDHFEKPIYEENEKASFYAFVESENYNSKELCISLGFNPTRRVSTILFSRFFPKKTSKVSQTTSGDQKIIKEKLSAFYQGHSFYFEDRLFDSGTYLNLKTGSEVVAGIRYKPVNWEIVEVPGFSGFMMQKVLPYLPLTRKLFNPKNLNFLAFDYAWGKTEHILELMEHALAEAGIYMGMFWNDIDSEIIAGLKESRKLGFLYRVNGEVTAEVMQRFINLDEPEKAELLSKPVFVSALDMT